MAIDYDPQEYIAALGNIGSGLNNKPGESFGVVDNLSNINRSFGNPFISSFTPTTDPTFTSGLNYARSIAGGQNIPNMIAPGVSYSAANPQGFTQLDLPPIVSGTPEVVTETPPDDPRYFDSGIGGVTIFDDVFDKKRMPPLRDIFGGQGDTSSLENLINTNKLFDGTFDFSNLDFGTTPNLPTDIEDRINIDDMPRFIDEELFNPKEVIQGPVGMPIPPQGPSKINDQLFIDDMPRFDDIPSKEYVVPEVPLNNLLNQNPPQGPVGMSPQETAKMSSQQELLNLIDNKDILQEIPADDGVRNQYQVELDKYINKSPINMDTYKEELPMGSAINLGIPSIMETVVPMAVPGLSLATNISNSFQNDFSPSPKTSPAPSTPSFTPGIDYSQVRRFGR